MWHRYSKIVLNISSKGDMLNTFIASFSNTWRSLPVGEDRAIVACQHVRDDRLRGLIVHLVLCCIWFKYFIKKIDFPL